MNMESVKAVAVVVMLAAIGVAAIAWTENLPDAKTWGFRVGSPIVALLLLGLLLRWYLRKDLARDYLRDQASTYFNCDGFGFTCIAAAVDGIAFMDVYFQNQYDKPCLARVAMRPGRGSFLTRAAIETLVYQIRCPPGAYGFARLPLPIPATLQGKQQTFEVGASVSYDDGKGKRLRFHDGIFIGPDPSFNEALGTVTSAVELIGTITTSATITVDLPVGVAEVVPPTMWPETKILWQLGDAPLTWGP